MSTPQLTAVSTGPETVDLATADPRALGRLCIMARLEAMAGNQRADLTFWVAGCHLERKVVVYRSVRGRRLRWWKPPGADRPTCTLLKVWVDELWLELQRSGVDVAALEREAKDALHLDLPSPAPGPEVH